MEQVVIVLVGRVLLVAGHAILDAGVVSIKSTSSR
jgi:hypothetical protein